MKDAVQQEFVRQGMGQAKHFRTFVLKCSGCDKELKLETTDRVDFQDFMAARRGGRVPDCGTNGCNGDLVLIDTIDERKL